MSSYTAVTMMPPLAWSAALVEIKIMISVRIAAYNVMIYVFLPQPYHSPQNA